MHKQGNGSCPNKDCPREKPNRHVTTFDFDGLTRAVFMAHARAIRFAVSSSGPGRIKLILHKRQREGSISQRHPDIMEAIKRYAIDSLPDFFNTPLESKHA